jgi:hypothetical protein
MPMIRPKDKVTLQVICTYVKHECIHLGNNTSNSIQGHPDHEVTMPRPVKRFQRRMPQVSSSGHAPRAGPVLSKEFTRGLKIEVVRISPSCVKVAM